MSYFYVFENDAKPRRGFRWLAKRVPTYSVYEADIDRETETFGPSRMVCSGLGRDQVRWFYSYPEARDELIASWRSMRDRDSWVADPAVTARLVVVVKAARVEHGPERDPRPLYTRTELDAMLGLAGDR